MAGLREAGARRGRRLYLICNPNNPDGHLFTPQELAGLARSLEPEDLLVVDESYAPFVGGLEEVSLLPYLAGLPNVAVLRSFSKIFGVPGLRLGFLAAHPRVVAMLQPHQLPWSVGAVAQAVGPLLLAREDLVMRAREFCLAQKDLLLQGISSLEGLEPLEGGTHFFLVRVAGGAASLCRSLEARGIMVRECRNFQGLPEAELYIRISPGLEEANRRLISCLGEVWRELHRPE